MKNKRQLLALGALICAPSAFAADVNVTADITVNTTWTADNEYILKKVIFVKPGITLTIEPGTKIYGTTDTVPNPVTYGSIVVTRGATIMAEGTKENPIIFTALEERDGFDDDSDPVTPNVFPDPELGDGGFYGGLVILGAAPINFYTGGVNDNENDVEGFPGGTTSDIRYGGNNPADNSGIIKYWSIRFGGFSFATDKEINGLTMGGVGSGTTVENIEIVSNTDDGMEIFGGTVNTKRIAVAFCQDDCFDLDEGHQGHHQFWFAIQNSADSLGDNLGEWDGGNGNISTGTPFNLIQVYNATLIGAGNGTGNDGIAMEDNFSGTLANSVLTDVDDDVIKDKSDGITGGTPKPKFLYNTFGTVGDISLFDNIDDGALTSPAGTGNGSINVDVKLRGISRTTDGNLDPRPAAGSPLLGAELAPFPASAPVGFYETVNYRGAFPSDQNWLDGWSYLSQKGYITPPADVIVTADITVNTTWTADNAYILKKVIFVKPGVTLTIEPGTKIYGTTDTVPNPVTYGSIVVTRGATIMAEGTKDNPIEFTALEERDGFDDDSDPLTPKVFPDPALGDGGFYGGLVILGAAPINFYTGGVNDNENDVEGFPGGTTSDIRYGGNNPADNSGIIKYWSIRFGGFSFATDKEINGLTMGGVGSGTTVENIEIVSNTDDGMEIFGGTVNTKRIAVAFCQDDCFDLDEGHQGHHQFWFAIQNSADSLGDNLGEWDGGNGNISTGTPFNLIQVYNATLIGAGNGTGNDGIAMEDNFSGTLANSVLTDVDDDVIKDKSDGITGGTPKPKFLYNTFGTVGDISLFDNIDDGALTSPAGSGNNGINVDVKLIGISRLPNGGLDPRPELNSPLRGAPLASFPSNAPVGFYETVNYRGAFGDTNWLNGWSYLSREGYLTGLPDGTSTEPTLVDTDRDGISDAVESANTTLGFNVNVSNGTPSTVFNGLFTETSILDLVAPNQVIVQKDSMTDMVTLSLDLFRSTTLETFTPAPALDVTFEATEPAEFYRIEVSGAE